MEGLRNFFTEKIFKNHIDSFAINKVVIDMSSIEV